MKKNKNIYEIIIKNAVIEFISVFYLYIFLMYFCVFTVFIDDISTSQIQRWQCILANENTVSAVSTDVAVPLFEHICRLMLLIQPQKLVSISNFWQK